jgi:hypothetical protein
VEKTVNWSLIVPDRLMGGAERNEMIHELDEEAKKFPFFEEPCKISSISDDQLFHVP